MGAAGQQALEFDTSVPNVARMYDYWLGGKDNFASDREAADRQARAIPQLPWLARQNRGFLQRAVDFCAREGVTQFLDIGSGLPTNENVHEITQRVNADSRVVYADNDPVVVAHARALLSGAQTAAVRGDAGRPDDILGAPGTIRVALAQQPGTSAGRAAVLYNARMGMVVCAGQLAEAPADKSYQLWIVPATGAPMSLGVMSSMDPAKLMTAHVPPGMEAKAFAITVEPKGGMPWPSGPKVLVGAGI